MASSSLPGRPRTLSKRCRRSSTRTEGSFIKRNSSQPIQWRYEMTDRLIVATFNDTNSAYDAASAIKNLKDSGLTEFKLKAGVMVKKDDRGNVSLIEDRNRPLIGTAVGTAAGALIGLLGGAPGVAVGAAIGATTGLSGDAVMAALDSDFVDSVTDGMRPGMTAIVVEADEGRTRAVDYIVGLWNCTVYRRGALRGRANTPLRTCCPAHV